MNQKKHKHTVVSMESTRCPLPASLELLLSFFTTLDTVLNIYQGRNIHRVRFDKIAKNVAEIGQGRTLEMKHIAQIMYLFPSAYILDAEEGWNEQNKRVMYLYIQITGQRWNMVGRKLFFRKQLERLHATFPKESNLKCPEACLPSFTVPLRPDPVSLLTPKRLQIKILSKRKREENCLNETENKELKCLGSEFIAKQRQKDELRAFQVATQSVRRRLTLLKRVHTRFYLMKEIFRNASVKPVPELQKNFQKASPGLTEKEIAEEIDLLLNVLPTWVELKKGISERRLVKMKNKSFSIADLNKVVKIEKDRLESELWDS